jgi:hypothetical protein
MAAWWWPTAMVHSLSHSSLLSQQCALSMFLSEFFELDVLFLEDLMTSDLRESGRKYTQSKAHKKTACHKW